MILESNGLSGLPCGTPFLRLVSFPFINIGALNHLRIRRSVKGHVTLLYSSCNKIQ